MKNLHYFSKSRLLFTLIALFMGISSSWAQKSLPYSYGFENNDLAAEGWITVNQNTGDSELGIYGFDAIKSGDYGFRFSSYFGSSPYDQYLISPELSASRGVIVEFYYKNSSSNSAETFQLGFSTTTSDITSFTWTDNISASGVTWKKYLNENFCPENTKFIAIHYTSSNKYRLYIDDINMSAPPTCIKPTGLTTADITSNSATLAWTSDADQFNIQYKKTTDSEWTDVSGTVTENPYTLAGLSPTSNYQVRVRTYCDATDQSDWTDAVSFTTDCATITEFPFTENFNGITAGIPMCWNNSEGTTTTESYKWNYYTTGHDGVCVRFNSYNNSTGLTNMLKTPAMSLPSGKTMQLNFWYKNPAGGDFSVFISNDGGDTYTEELATGLTGASDWTKKEITLPDGFTENVVIVFKGTSSYGSGDAYIYLDDVTIQEAPSCIVPTGLTVADITSNGATLNWTSDADNFNVRYKKVSDNDWTEVSDVISGKTYSLTGLIPATNYQVQVRTYCDTNDQSVWTDAVSFTTDCVAITEFPYTENFNGITSGIPVCWNNSDGTTTNDAYKWNYYTTGHDGACVRFNSYNNSTGLTNMLKTPAMSLPSGKTMQLSFWYKNPTGGDFSVYISNDGGATYTTALATGLTNKSNWEKKEIVIPTGFSENVVIVFKGTSNYSNGDAYIYLDDVTIDEAPACIVPTELAANNATANSVELSWTNGSDEEAWQIAYGTTADFDADEVTPIDANTNPFTLTGLSAETTYYVCVRSKKGTDVSAWSDKVSFTTPASCIAPTDFAVSGLTLNSATLTWTDATEQSKWEVSYSTTNGDPDAGTIVPVTEKTYTITGLTAGNTYYASVRAVNSDDDKSAWSTEISFTPGVLTVNDGTTQNYYVPLYGDYASVATGTQSQFIIPAESLADLAGNQIDKIAFYCSSASKSWGNASFDVYVKEVENTTFTSTTPSWDGMTKVYSGQLSVANGLMTIQFNEPFEYTNKNLMIGINQTVKGKDSGAYWYGITTTQNTAIDGKNGQYCTFLPKTDIYYSAIEIAPKMVVSETEFKYGLVAQNSEQAKTFTIENKGKAPLEGITVSSSNTAFTVTEVNNQSIAVNGEAITVTVTFDTTTPGDYDGTITVSATGQDNATIAVSGIVRNPNKVYLDFADGQIPDGWTSVAIGSYASQYGSAWTASEGYVSQSGSSSSYAWAFTSPKLNFTNGELIAFETAKYGSSTWNSPSITVEYTTDETGATGWTAIGSAFTDDTYGNWTSRSVKIPVEGVKRIRFNGWYVHLRNIYGGELPLAAKMKVTVSDYDFGMITEAANTTFTIANTGNIALEGIQVQSDNAAFTFADVPTTLAAGESATVTIAMSAENKGLQNGIVTVSATDQDDVTFNVTGYVVDESKFYETFADNALPAGWEVTGSTNTWSFTDGVAKSSFSSSKGYLITPALTVEGTSDVMVFQAKSTFNGSVTIKIQKSVNGEDWTSCKSINLSSSDQNIVKTYTISGLEAGSYKFRFECEDYELDNFNGFTLNANAPALTVSPTTAADFGKVTETPEAKTYTITNSGTGTLTGTIASDNEAFTVSENAFSLTAGESMTFDIALVFDENYGDKSATITIHPTNQGLSDVTIAATATTKDPNIWEEDFENGIPASWSNTGWTLVNAPSYGNGTKMAYATTTAGYMLTTPRLEAKKDEVLTFEALLPWSDETLTVEYAVEDGNGVFGEWIKDSDNTPENNNTLTTLSFTAPADGYYKLRFSGRYNYVDNFSGFKLAMKEHDAEITSTNIPATGKQYAEYTATVTVKEMVGVEEELTAKFFIGDTQYGEAVVKTVAANGTETFTVTFTPEAAISGDAYFTVSNNDIALTSSIQSMEIAAALVLDETVAGEISTGIQPFVVKYTAKSGWNTICMPFALTDDILTNIFGEGWKAYEFKSYEKDLLGFDKATTFYAGYPYIIYVAEAAEHANGVILNNVNITKTTAQNDSHGNATFQGTFAPIAAPGMEGKWGVTNEAKIAKGTNEASIKGFRAYFELPDGANARLSFFDDATGITTIIGADELNDDKAYNLSGQRVQNPKKGLYIINGKKVVMK